MSKEFGQLLRKYRKNSTDPDRGGLLTLERLAEFLEREANVGGYTYATISNWERGESTIRADDRAVLIGVISVLHKCGGIQTLSEAQTLLDAGNYRALNFNEVSQVDKDWSESAQRIPLASFTPTNGDKKPSFWMILKNAFNNRKSRMFSWVESQREAHSPFDVFPLNCGEKGIDLAQQRLLVSSTFGSYFASLLESDHSYISLDNQIESPTLFGKGLVPIQSIFWALQRPKGPRLLVIAAEGGMGKSTLAAKIIRCLFEEQAIDLILGDSAKNQGVDIATGELISLVPGYYDAASFYERMHLQLSLPRVDSGLGRKNLENIRDRLLGRRALIVVDNLEVVQEGDELLHILKAITSRDIRALVTTRNVGGLKTLSNDSMMVNLKPLTNIQSVQDFLTWHIAQHQDKQPGLTHLRDDVMSGNYISKLIDRTGGIPLLIQIVFSNIARYSWTYLDQLPANLFGDALLKFLYQQHWQELEELEEVGKSAQAIIKWTAQEQYRGRKITFHSLNSWFHQNYKNVEINRALKLLYERFLIVNKDYQQGNFSILPSLVEFVAYQ